MSEKSMLFDISISSTNLFNFDILIQHTREKEKTSDKISAQIREAPLPLPTAKKRLMCPHMSPQEAF